MGITGLPACLGVLLTAVTSILSSAEQAAAVWGLASSATACVHHGQASFSSVWAATALTCQSFFKGVAGVAGAVVDGAG